MLQHGFSWSGDHHTSVKQTTLSEKIEIGNIKHVQERYRNLSCVLLRLLSVLKILVENLSLYDQSV